ncbi:MULTISPECIES: prolipoprotein diacylglyceryl transferase [Marivita]|uniref:Phosphatidylglycerol--prolipoprotein diacylglyceryl transferase n=1 Tax=Marivita cryptomonadis TaxID=505252 RepID=A0A9Q2S1J0_9RHOB|nr:MULTISPECIES: prolipoprotein diacylglyceryl transferase [Marivita]MCR9170246.1 prolipoprotein diacylglyceryl transferase [Paracoccaceae bacterium]MBM2321450.1 prolipoprotein diacylglyceryl transferase [Marivita cryptomonadis]MBM2331031.1 prolipoprotein diacylglyceryl transferase [Marivita cryptomonadis]MBM2340617.1 prolipoprotein diacylglyceryl transferase [Marivita cryptomonadis]MBM2345279.1 prolipoprotein diacylglyceryl transferase [Marivita cryptomonadis]
MSTGLPFPNVSPELFSISIFGMEFALRWYALAYIAGILIGWRIAVAAVKRTPLWADDTPPMRPEQVEELLTWVILGVILGGRLGFVLFYQPGYYLQNPAEILAVWQGGMSFHGGLIGVIVAALMFCFKNSLPLRPTADMMAIATPPGLLLGRISNFINAELWGRPTDLPWGVQFPGQAAQSCGQTLGEICARHPSQLYEALLEGLLLGAVLLWLAFRRGALKVPGRIVGLFIGGYGAARFMVEFVRQPDAQFVSDGNPLGLAWQIGGYGLTMGQLLSVPMIAIGIYLWLSARRAGAVRDT